MSKLSFFYDADTVYSTSLKALKRREYKVISFDEEAGLIIAKSKKGLLKPQITVEIKISNHGENQTNVDIHSKIKKNWLTIDGYEAKEENKLINTLYKLFEHS